MSDTYLELVNSGPAAAVAKKLGLPRPAPLRRTDADAVDQPLTPGPVLVLSDSASTGEADAVAADLLGWDLDVRRDTRLGDHDRWGAVVVVLTGLPHPAQLSEPALTLGSVLRKLAPSGRVVTLSRTAPPTLAAPSGDDVDPALAAARHGVDGFLRSVAKELRAGATGHGLVLADRAEVSPVSVRGGSRCRRSARSGVVAGRLLTAGPEAGTGPGGWRRPRPGAVAGVPGGARGTGGGVVRVLARGGAPVLGVGVPAAGEARSAVMNAVGG